jgi:hypothetical protein
VIKECDIEKLGACFLTNKNNKNFMQPIIANKKWFSYIGGWVNVLSSRLGPIKYFFYKV